MEETWKDIEGYEGYYQISSLGRVRAMDRYIDHPRTKLTFRKGGIKPPSKSANGYLTISMYIKGKCKGSSVHRLVAEAFIPNIENKPQINHINGNKQDNRVENLEWVTSSENIQHAHDTGLLKCAIGSRHGKSKLTEEDVYKIKFAHNDLNEYQIADMYKVSFTTIYDIIKGRTWIHIKREGQTVQI